MDKMNKIMSVKIIGYSSLSDDFLRWLQQYDVSVEKEQSGIWITYHIYASSKSEHFWCGSDIPGWNIREED